MRNVMKSALVGAALLAMTGGCKDECETAADCADQPALEAGEVYACREQVCTAVAQPYAVYGLQDDGRRAYLLGQWPSLAKGTTPLFDVFAPADRQLDPQKFEIFTGGYLANDGTRLLSGYTKPDVTGQVAVHTLGVADAQYVSVPGNFTATGSEGTFYVSALKGPSFSSGAMVYALNGTTVREVAHTGVAASASGPVAIATNGAAVFGYADASANYVSRLHTLAPTSYAVPGDAVNLTTLARLDLGETFDVAPFGKGVAVLRGTQNPSTFARTYSDVVHVALSDTGIASAPQPVLRFVDQCSRVSIEAGIGEDLLVRISDHQGKNRVLVRLTAAEGPTSPARTPAADCATAQRDPVLGTLELKEGFLVVDSAPLPDGVGAVTAVPTAP